MEPLTPNENHCSKTITLQKIGNLVLIRDLNHSKSQSEEMGHCISLFPCPHLLTPLLRNWRRYLTSSFLVDD